MIRRCRRSAVIQAAAALIFITAIFSSYPEQLGAIACVVFLIGRSIVPAKRSRNLLNPETQNWRQN